MQTKNVVKNIWISSILNLSERDESSSLSVRDESSSLSVRDESSSLSVRDESSSSNTSCALN